MTVYLPFPEDHSPNDSISESLCSLTYVSVDDATRSVLRLGRGALLAKMDIRNVHLDDHWLLGMTWRQGVFFDTVLPFALRSAQKIFNVVADVLEWIMRRDGVRKMLPLP